MILTNSTINVACKFAKLYVQNGDGDGDGDVNAYDGSSVFFLAYNYLSFYA